jgi:hypothetical protein
MSELHPPRARERFRRMRRAREPRWYLVDGYPRRSLWPPAAALARAPELRRWLELARASIENHADPSTDRGGERRWVRAVLDALERALRSDDLSRAGAGGARAAPEEQQI